jgi:hypothetical protein
MIHERFDVQRWCELFPMYRMRTWARTVLQANPKAVWAMGEVDCDAKAWLSVAGSNDLRETGALWHLTYLDGPISSPYQLALLEQERAEAGLRTGLDRHEPHRLPSLVGFTPEYRATEAQLRDRVPVDVFVYGRGHGQRREVTKIGGLPYWPARRPWPHTGDGRPMTFVFQVCFADSRDIVTDLPGDVLLCFSDTDACCFDGSERLTLEWMRLGETDLVDRKNVPATPMYIAPVYGVIHRTYDYPSLYNDYDNPLHRLSTLNGTKIGGQPYWIQSHWDEIPVICTCSTVAPHEAMPFPYINVAPPLIDREEHSLQWGDSGNCYVYREDSIRFVASWDCY